MAWTSPMTFVANNVLTAAQMNTHLRDNLLEFAAAKSSTNQGSWFPCQGPNRIEERYIRRAFVDPQENSYTGSYGDLPTVGPSVTMETGTSAIVLLQARIGNTQEDQSASMGFAISGETEKAASDTYSIQQTSGFGGFCSMWGGAFFVDGLNPGLNTFTCKYKTNGGSSTAGESFGVFGWRFLGVIGL